MMRYWILLTLLSCFAVDSLARDLNSIEAHLFRLSDHQNPEAWVNPFKAFPRKSYKKFQFGIFLSLNHEVPDLIADLGSKDTDRISDRLSDSFGQPFDLSAKIHFGYHYKNFSQSLSENAGAVAIINDPVFPELKELLFHDFASTSAYLFRPRPNLFFRPQLTLGLRQTLDLSLSAIELSTTKADRDIRNKPVKFFSTMGMQLQYISQYADFLLLGNSLPIIKSEQYYWNIILGIKSKNITEHLPLPIFTDFRTYFSYSPLHSGVYNSLVSLKLGAETYFTDNLSLDLYINGNYKLGTSLKLALKAFSISIFSFERSYNDNYTQTSRQYGLSILTQI